MTYYKPPPLLNLLAVLVTALMFVWPMMYTIGLRYAIAGFLVVATFFWCHSSGGRDLRVLKSRPVINASALLFVLSLWFIGQGLWFAPGADWIWDELRGQWAKDIAFWCLGLVLGAVSLCQRKQGSNQLLLALLLGMLGIVLVNVLTALYLLLCTGDLPIGYGGATGTRTLDSYINNMLLAFLIGDILSREKMSNFLPWARSRSVMLIVVCLFNTVVIGTRHGWVGVGMLICSAVAVHYITGWRHLGKKSFFFLPVLIALLLVGAWGSWKLDPRWNTLRETLPIAWDIDTNKAWLNSSKYQYPALPDGTVVHPSNYERPAWIHAGFRLVAAHPLGTGFGRHAFGRELVRLYPESEPAPGAHAHSAIVDLAVGGGMPAVFLWLGFMSTLIWFGAVGYFRHGSGAGLVLMFLSSGFLGRSVLDSIMRDHSMEQFMFMAAFLLPMVSDSIKARAKE